jgi:hypothetical protein
MARAGFFTSHRMVSPQNIRIYRVFCVVKSVAAPSEIRSTDGIRVEVFVSAGFTEFIGNRGLIVKLKRNMYD